MGVNDFLAYFDDLDGVLEHLQPNSTGMTASKHRGQTKVLPRDQDSNRRVGIPTETMADTSSKQFAMLVTCGLLGSQHRQCRRGVVDIHI